MLNDIHSLTLSESEFPLSQIDSSDILDGASLCKVFGEVLEDAGLPIRISMEQVSVLWFLFIQCNEKP